MLAGAHPGCSAQPKLPEELSAPMEPPQPDPQHISLGGQTHFFLPFFSQERVPPQVLALP